MRTFPNPLPLFASLGSPTFVFPVALSATLLPFPPFLSLFSFPTVPSTTLFALASVFHVSMPLSLFALPIISPFPLFSNLCSFCPPYVRLPFDLVFSHDALFPNLLISLRWMEQLLNPKTPYFLAQPRAYRFPWSEFWNNRVVQIYIYIGPGNYFGTYFMGLANEYVCWFLIGIVGLQILFYFYILFLFRGLSEEERWSLSRK